MNRWIFVSAVVRDEHGRILLVQEAKPENHGLWNIPGGGLEIGESFEDGVHREVREETGLIATRTELLRTYVRHGGAPWLRAVFFVEATGEAVAGDEILSVRWAALDEIEALDDAQVLGPIAMRSLIDDLRRGTRGGPPRLIG